MRSKAICLVIRHYHFFLLFYFLIASSASHSSLTHTHTHSRMCNVYAVCCSSGPAQYFCFRFRTFIQSLLLILPSFFVLCIRLRHHHRRARPILQSHIHTRSANVIPFWNLNVWVMIFPLSLHFVCWLLLFFFYYFVCVVWECGYFFSLVGIHINVLWYAAYLNDILNEPLRSDWKPKCIHTTCIQSLSRLT